MAVGRWIFSRVASSEGVSGPWQAIVASAALWVGLRSPPASWRMRRASRVMTGRRRWARSVVEMVRIAN